MGAAVPSTAGFIPFHTQPSAFGWGHFPDKEDRATVAVALHPLTYDNFPLKILKEHFVLVTLMFK